MAYFNESDVKIIMLTGKSESEAKQDLNRGAYIMELQDFIDNYWAVPEEERLSAGLDVETCVTEYEEELWSTERTIAAVTETAKRIKNFSDGYFEVADEFNTVVNFDGKQHVIHWAL